MDNENNTPQLDPMNKELLEVSRLTGQFLDGQNWTKEDANTNIMTIAWYIVEHRGTFHSRRDLVANCIEYYYAIIPKEKMIQKLVGKWLEQHHLTETNAMGMNNVILGYLKANGFQDVTIQSVYDLTVQFYSDRPHFNDAPFDELQQFINAFLFKNSYTAERAKSDYNIIHDFCLQQGVIGRFESVSLQIFFDKYFQEKAAGKTIDMGKYGPKVS